MKPLFAFCLLLCLGLCAHGERKYGFLADTDQNLFKVVRSVDAAILGRIDQDIHAGIGWDLHVTVIDCYKGDLKPGDRVFIAIAAESGPIRKKKSARNASFSDPNSHVVPDVAGSFWCDWTENVRYEKYGEPMRKLLRSTPEYELAEVNRLLAASEDRVIQDPEKDTAFPHVGGSFGSGYAHPLLSMRWVSRAELLARKHYWEQCRTRHAVPRGTPQGELCEGFVFTDFSVCNYEQAVASDDDVRSLIAEGERTVWEYWVPPENGPKLYKLFADLPKIAQTKPDETSWLVMMQYFEDGKYRLKHFYVPSRLGIQTLLGKVSNDGLNCSNWKSSDKRLWTIPEWMRSGLKYDPAIWYQ